MHPSNCYKLAALLTLALCGVAHAQSVNYPLPITGPTYSSGVIDTCTLPPGHFQFPAAFTVDGQIAAFTARQLAVRAPRPYEVFVSSEFEAVTWVCTDLAGSDFVGCTDASTGGLMHVTVPSAADNYWVVVAPKHPLACGEIQLTATH